MNPSLRVLIFPYPVSQFCCWSWLKAFLETHFIYEPTVVANCFGTCVCASCHIRYDRLLWSILRTRGASNGWHWREKRENKEHLTSTKWWWEVPLRSTARWYNTCEDTVSFQYKTWLAAVSDLVPHVVPRAMNDSIWDEAWSATCVAGQDCNTKKKTENIIFDCILSLKHKQTKKYAPKTTKWTNQPTKEEPSSY